MDKPLTIADLKSYLAKGPSSLDIMAMYPDGAIKYVSWFELVAMWPPDSRDQGGDIGGGALTVASLSGISAAEIYLSAAKNLLEKTKRAP